ncbi:MAG: hypothetical protein EXX96DRAFT_143149 [Benjaminiella poitrasii]|nr:MAG: hypothetical protein EXX96DRAFT_143149 [Benjaminiella poitrasii]
MLPIIYTTLPSTSYALILIHLSFAYHSFPFFFSNIIVSSIITISKGIQNSTGHINTCRTRLQITECKTAINKYIFFFLSLFIGITKKKRRI